VQVGSRLRARRTQDRNRRWSELDRSPERRDTHRSMVMVGWGKIFQSGQNHLHFQLLNDIRLATDGITRSSSPTELRVELAEALARTATLRSVGKLIAE
jgi:hypothetical protein